MGLRWPPPHREAHERRREDVSRLLREGPSSALNVVVNLFADIVVLSSHLLNLSSFLSGDD